MVLRPSSGDNGLKQRTKDLKLMTQPPLDLMTELLFFFRVGSLGVPLAGVGVAVLAFYLKIEPVGGDAGGRAQPVVDVVPLVVLRQPLGDHFAGRTVLALDMIAFSKRFDRGLVRVALGRKRFA